MRPRLSRRDAEAFAVAVDAPAGDRARSASPDHVRELVEVAELLRGAPAPTAAPDFVAGLRAQLMAAAHEELAPIEEPAPVEEPAAASPVEPRHRRDRSPRLRRRLAAAATSFVVAGGSFGLVAASAQAVPGDMLYPVKRATEKFELLVRDGASEGRALLGHAQTRLGELESLTADPGRGAEDLIAQTLADFTAEANAGGALLLDAYREDGSRDQIGHLRAFTADSARRLESLAGSIPSSAAAEYSDATKAVGGLDASAYQACPVCAGGDPVVSIDPDLVSDVTSALDTAPPSIRPERSDTGLEDRTTAAQQPLDGLDIPVPTIESSKPPAEDTGQDPATGPEGGDDGPLSDPVDELDDAVKGDEQTPGKPVKDLTKPVEDLTQPLTDTVNQLLSGLLGNP